MLQRESRLGDSFNQSNEQWHVFRTAACHDAVCGHLPYSCFTPPRAIEVGRRMEDNNYFWFEEPCPYWELEWTAEVAASLKMNEDGSVLVNLAGLARLGQPLLVGPSRKSFLVEGQAPLPPADRDWGTAAAVAVAVMGGAHIVRVHNVAAMAQVARVTDALRAQARA